MFGLKPFSYLYVPFYIKEPAYKMSMDSESLAHRRNLLSKATDCSFLVGQGKGRQRFEANKGVLAMVSPVFMAMFYGEQAKEEQAKKRKIESEVIEIPDVTPAGFQMLLHQAYFLPALADPSVDVALDILYAGHKYMISSLETMAIEYLKKEISAETVFVILQAAELYEKKELAEFCLDFIKKNTLECLKSDHFLQATLTQLRQMFACPELSIWSEMDLLQALERHVEANGLSRSEKSEKKAEIEEVLKQVRFLSLDFESFDQLILSNLLTGDEKAAIAAHLGNSKSTCVIPDIISSNRENRGMKCVQMCEHIKKYFDKHGSKEVNFTCKCPHHFHSLSTFLWDCASFNVDARGAPLNLAFEKFGMEKNIQKVVESDNKELKVTLCNNFEKRAIDVYKFYKL